MKKICIDGRQLTKPMTGIGTFLQSALRSLQKNKNLDLYVLLPRGLHESVDIRFESNVHIVICPLLGNEKTHRFLWFLFKLPFVLRKINPDVYLSVVTALPLWLPKRTKSIVVVHDVVNKEFANTMSFQNRIANLFMFDRAVRKADLLWANSKYTKGKIEEYYAQRSSSNIEVGCAADRSLFKRVEMSQKEKLEIKQHFGIAEKFILFVGTLEPRKNLRFLLSLMPALSQHGLQLIVVGGRGWENTDFYDFINSSNEIKRSVNFAGYVSNKQLVQLYNIADCYVSTSLNEGFGMPQLEAMLCECPVVTAHNSAMIEVVSGRGVTVKGWSKEDWLNAILNAVKKGRTRYDLCEYDWDLIVKRIPFLN